MTKNLVFILACFVMISACQPTEKKQKSTPSGISEATVAAAVKAVSDKNPATDAALLGKGVKHAASLWRDADGTSEDFTKFCADNFIADPTLKEATSKRFSEYFESLYGHFNKLTLDLQENVQLLKGEVLPIDPMFAAYSPGAHLTNDLYDNKIAFIVALNFPYFSTEEKNQLGCKLDSAAMGICQTG